jgi:hypothetical protein
LAPTKRQFADGSVCRKASSKFAERRFVELIFDNLVDEFLN